MTFFHHKSKPKPKTFVRLTNGLELMPFHHTSYPRISYHLSDIIGVMAPEHSVAISVLSLMA